MAMLTPVVALSAAESDVPDLPLYVLDVRLDSERHTLSGTLRVTLPSDDPRAGRGWVFHLPPNRFLESDSRGRRRSTDSLPFATNFEENGAFDPLWPDGFSDGGIEVHRVVDTSGRERVFTLEDNPDLPSGYSVRDGLLRVEPLPQEGAGKGAQGAETALDVEFTTRLPERYWDGWNEEGMLAEQWHPVMAEWREGRWITDPFVPRGGRFSLRFRTDREGWLFAGQGMEARLPPGGTVNWDDPGTPMRSMPLAFLPERRVMSLHDYEVSIHSYFAPGHERGGDWALKVAAGFLEFVREKYRLPPPDTRIALVEVPLPPGDIRTVGALVLIPSEFFDNPPILDRVFLAQLTRALAQIWFGEAVWSHRDLESWLHLGLGGYLALDFFHSLYGWSAGIHDIVDWLQPKYREHFFEAPVRGMMRQDHDAPVMVSVSGYERERSALLAVHNKAPLIMRSLFYVVGRDAFSRGLNALYFHYRYREVKAAQFIRELEDVSGRDLAPFVQAWFYGTPRVDFAVEDWEEEYIPTGIKVRVQVRREGAPLLPVDIRVTSEGGEVVHHRWEEGPDSAELEFLLQHPVQEIVIDPEEYWLELDRKNNRSGFLYRVRPIFDWAKQRELLVALRGTGGGNAIDGNYLGLGVRLQFNENNSLIMIPIYGERTGLTNYTVEWQWTQFLFSFQRFRLLLERLGGTTLQGVGLDWDVVDNDDFFLRPGIEARKETVRDAGYLDQGVPVTQEAGVANNMRYLLEFGKKQGVYYGNKLEIEVVDGRPSYGSEFDFSTALARFDQKLTLGNDHALSLLLVRGASDGHPPFQMRHTLGGPEVLRGYPRLLELSFEHMAAARLEYALTFTREIQGSSAQVRSITGFMFGDVGRGWNDEERYDTHPQRQNVGVGFEVMLNLLRLVEFPVRGDIAVPIRDEEYKNPQYILFGIFNF